MSGTPFVATRPGPPDSCLTMSLFVENTSRCLDGAYPHPPGEPFAQVAPEKMPGSRQPSFFLHRVERGSQKRNARNVRKPIESPKFEVHERPLKKRTLYESQDHSEVGL